MNTDSERNISPASGSTTAPAKRRVRYVLPQGAIIGGIYEIEKPLGHGGMGEVYLVRHTKLDIYRAIKILLPKVAAANPMFATRFMQEARLAIQIQHPNIINVMDANRDERLNIYYIVMELVDGASIRNLLKQNGPFGEKEAMEIALYAGRALEAADKSHIVHRDIKPGNIMLTKDNQVKIADLGIAKSAVDNCLNDIASNALIGTPSYVSPEQAENAGQVDCRADIYSLGVTLYEMLTGEKPYTGTSSMEVLDQVLNSPVPDVREKKPRISNRTAKLIMKMMEKDRDRRPPNWTDFCSEVESILGRTMAINVMRVIEKEKQLALTRTQLEQVCPPGLIPDGRKSFSGGSQPKLRKAVRIAIHCLTGFLVCLILMTLLLNGKIWKRDFILFCMGQPYKSECIKYNLIPPLNIAFADSTVKAGWLETNKPKPPPVQVIPVGPHDVRDLTPTDSDEYAGGGKLEFVLDEKTPPAVTKYLDGKKLLFIWKDGKHEAGLSCVIPVPAAKYCLELTLPGCEKIQSEVDLKSNRMTTIRILPVPVKGKVKINCNESGCKVRSGAGDWLAAGDAISADTLKKIEIEVRKEGFKPYRKEVYLQPGEEKSLDVKLEKQPEFDISADKEHLEKAESLFKSGKYSDAEKTYKELADKMNPQALYRMGQYYECGYGNLRYKRSLEKAFKYYFEAAEKGSASACYKVGYFHENGLGGQEKNKTKAQIWYRKGTDLKDGDCWYRLGRLYEEKMNEWGPDSENARKKALQCYEEAYKAGLVEEKKVNLKKLIEELEE